MPFRPLSYSRRLSALLVVPAVAAGIVGSMLTAPAALAATGTPYYVDCSSKTPGDGIIATAPLTTLAAVNARGFIAGDQILFKRGTTCSGRLLLQGAGVAGNPIVVGSWGTGARPTIAGGGTGQYTGAVQLVNPSYFTVQDLHITNKTASANTKSYRTGLLLLNNNGGRLRGVTVRRLAIDSVRSNPGNGNARMYGGISALTFGSTKSWFDGLTISDNTVSSVSRTGIITSNTQYPKASDTNVRITGNSLKSIRGDGIVVIGAQHSRIDTNTVVGAGDLGSCAHCGRMGGPETASAGIWPANTRWIRIDHNEVSKTRNTGGDGEGFDIDRSARDTAVEYNYAHDNQGGAVLLCGATDSVIRFNVLENNGQGALTFYGKAPSTNTSFYNNTVYLSKSSKAKVVRTFGAIKGSKVSFKNNIVFSYGPGQYQWPTKQVTTAANTLIGTLGSGRPRDAATSFVNPLLRGAGTAGNGFASLKKAYTPKNPSSAKRGVAIPSSVKTDIFGKRINAKKPPRGAAG